MDLKQIYTQRNRAGQGYAQPIIYEWEDVIAKEFDIPVINIPSFYRLTNRMDIHAPFVGPQKNTFRFVINGRDYDEPMNNKHIIPCIIDFHENKNQLQEFYKKHSRNKIVLFSSPFDYEYLKENNCPLRIGLFAYTLSDIYNLKERKIEKRYDVVLTGRQDPLLYDFFKRYISCHPEVTYVKRGQELENDSKKTKDYYLNGKECLGSIESREDFMNLQAQGRVTLYGVQGYLDSLTKGFYHMTPHFLEIIACGCHILCRYPVGKEGIDAQYYEFSKFSPSIETYEEFEFAMDNALSTPIDMKKYSTYLKKHYTSTRVTELKKILKEL